ncbi:ABC transporter permease [Nocardia australiensis]|uniref:ABC transporter permease n=1 Tax=Nocardia australiensis TaxID=2887191 RepID=UPI001D15CAEE|nr:ABC transporter permease [Nocardia australiensis]
MTPTISAPSLLSASAIIARRTVSSWRQQIGAMATVWLFPVFTTLLFLGLFGGALDVPAESTYTDFLIPGMLAVTMLFGLETTTLSAAADATHGINDRLRSFPINSTAIVLGRAAADLLSSLISLALMVGFALAVGWRPDLHIANVVLVLVLLVALRFALLWIGIFIGYGAKSVESVAYIQILTWPIAFLSSAFVNPATMPGWLGTLAELNPISTTATAVRELLGSTSWPTQSFVGDHALTLAVLWPLLLTAAYLPLAARRFRRGGK